MCSENVSVCSENVPFCYESVSLCSENKTSSFENVWLCSKICQEYKSNKHIPTKNVVPKTNSNQSLVMVMINNNDFNPFVTSNWSFSEDFFQFSANITYCSENISLSVENVSLCSENVPLSKM